MGKEKEMLKAILQNTQLIIKHLKIDSGAPADNKEATKTTAADGKKSPKKVAPAKKATSKK